MSVKRAVHLATAGIIGLVLVINAVAWRGFNADHEAMVAVTEVTEPALVAMVDTRFHVVQIQQFLTDVSATGDDAGFADAAEQAKAAKTSLEKIARLMPATGASVREITAGIDTLHDVGVKMARAYLDKGREAGNAMMKAPGTGLDDRAKQLTSQLEALEKTLQDAAKAADLAAAETNRSSRNLSLIIGLAGIVLVVVLGQRALRRMMTALGGEPALAVAVAQRVANNDLSIDVVVPPGSESSLMAALDTMQTNLRARHESDRRAAAEMTRIKSALDRASTAVMICDNERTIIYANESVRQVLQAAEADIRKVLPGFSAERLIGQNIDQFHKNPRHQADMLATLTKTHVAELTIGVRRMQVVANPVLNEAGERLGAVAEWKDRTAELNQSEREAKTAAENLRVRMALDNVSIPVRIADNDGQVIYANHELLRLLRRIEGKLKEQNSRFSVDSFVGSSIGNLYADPEAALKRLASITQMVDTVMDIGGRTFRVVTTPVLNDKNERLGTIGEWQDRTDQLAVEKEIATLVDAAARGDLDQRIDATGKEGFYATLASGLNQFVETTRQALTATTEVLAKVAQGDLTRTVDADFSGIFGELKDDTNTTISRLREVVGRIKESTELIDTAAKEIAAGNTDLSSRTEEQASSLEETASSMEELNSTVKQNAENAAQANALARTSNEAAEKSGAVVRQIVSTMTGISESSKKIADIIGVIDGIAFQTNILALNAAVEAARAGEQGRGFAVVATEVRNLAQRSATAAREIKELIAESTGKVDTGTRLVDQAGSSMESVVNSFRQVTALVTDIANASREQAGGIEQVTQAVGQMDEVTQQNAALVEEAAAAAESLQEQTLQLSQAVAMFTLDARGAVKLPGPALRDATPRQLTAPRTPPRVAHSGAATVPARSAEGDEWAEF